LDDKNDCIAIPAGALDQISRGDDEIRNVDGGERMDAGDSRGPTWFSALRVFSAGRGRLQADIAADETYSWF
jgi:hypothetical protein